MGYRDPARQRAADRERFRKRTAERVAQGLCPRCGERSPELGRALCDGCAEKRNRADRARDARLRAAGKPRRDSARAAEYERERTRREREEKRARGLCIRCGTRPAAPDRASCEPCLEKRREADRKNYAAGKAAGLPYGGADPDARKKYARARSKRIQKARTDAGLCIRCGARPPADGGATCIPCRDKRQAAERRQYRDRRAAGLLRALRRAGLRRSLALRPLRRRRGRAPEPGAEERAVETEIRRSAARAACARRAERRPRGRRDAPGAPSVRITARRISGGSRSGTRAGR